MPELKKNWAPTERTFSRFLNWLDGGVDSGGERYLEMRRRLELYFLRRNCERPDELADETLNRIARRLDEEGTITAPSPAHYCYIVAKHVFHESLRARNGVVQLAPDEAETIPAPERDPRTRRDADDLLTVLEQCLDMFPHADRDLILDYYRGEKRVKIDGRRALAARLGLTMNALTIRACRLREKLERCIKAKIAPE